MHLCHGLMTNEQQVCHVQHKYEVSILDVISKPWCVTTQ